MGFMCISNSEKITTMTFKDMISFQYLGRSVHRSVGRSFDKAYISRRSVNKRNKLKDLFCWQETNFPFRLRASGNRLDK